MAINSQLQRRSLLGLWVHPDSDPPGKATGVSAIAGDKLIKVSFTTPANPGGGFTDRVGIAIADNVVSAESDATSGNFAMIFDGLVELTTYTARIVAEEFAGVDLVNGTLYHIIVVPGRETGAFFKSSVTGDAVSATPVADISDTIPPGKATGVSALAKDASIEVSFTTPADPSGGTTDRVGIAIATDAASTVTDANSAIFSVIFSSLEASTDYTGRIVSELFDGTDLLNGTEYHLIVAAGRSTGFFNTSAVEGDAVTATPVAVVGDITPPAKVTSLVAI